MEKVFQRFGSQFGQFMVGFGNVEVVGFSLFVTDELDAQVAQRHVVEEGVEVVAAGLRFGLAPPQFEADAEQTAQCTHGCKHLWGVVLGWTGKIYTQESTETSLGEQGDSEHLANAMAAQVTVEVLVERRIGLLYVNPKRISSA